MYDDWPSANADGEGYCHPTASKRCLGSNCHSGLWPVSIMMAGQVGHWRWRRPLLVKVVQ